MGLTADAPVWSPSERAAWQPPPRQTVSEWADAHRILSARKGSAEPGPWRTSRTPYLRGPQDAMGDPSLEVVVIVKPAQVGGSEACRNALAYWIDRDAGPAIIVYPSEAAAREQMRDRIGPMLGDTPQLAQYLPGDRNDVTSLELDLTSMPVHAAWAGSAQALASRPARYVILDEVDKYPPYAGRDADPISLAMARTRTYGHRRKVVIVSTPTTDKGAVWTEFEACADRRRYWVPCPRCGEFQILTRDRFRWQGYPEEPTPEEVELHGVYYECAHCAGRIEERERDHIVERGEWRQEPDENGAIVEGSRRRGFQLSAFVATIGVRWRDLIAKWFRVKGDPAALMEYVTQDLGEPFRDLVKSVKDSALEAKKALGNPRGVVPTWAACVLLTADTQKDRFYWLARAWGAGERSQLVDLGVAKTFADLDALLVKKWPLGTTPQTMRATLMMIDSGGGTETDGGANRTDEVYRWAGKHADRVIPSKGVGGNHDPLSTQDVRVGMHTYKRAGYSAFKVRLAHLNTQRLKDILAGRINHEPEPGKPSIWELCDGLPPEYFDHLKAEHKIGIRKGLQWIERWVSRSHGRRNDYLDCEAYQIAAAKLIGAEYVADEAALREKRAGPASASAQPASRSVATMTPEGGGPAWVDGRGWWSR